MEMPNKGKLFGQVPVTSKLGSIKAYSVIEIMISLSFGNLPCNTTDSSYKSMDNCFESLYV